MSVLFMKDLHHDQSTLVTLEKTGARTLAGGAGPRPPSPSRSGARTSGADAARPAPAPWRPLCNAIYMEL